MLPVSLGAAAAPSPSFAAAGLGAAFAATAGFGAAGLAGAGPVAPGLPRAAAKISAMLMPLPPGAALLPAGAIDVSPVLSMAVRPADVSPVLCEVGSEA